MLRAIDMIARERRRQIKELDFSIEDDLDMEEELLQAAQAYSEIAAEVMRFKGSGLSGSEKESIIFNHIPDCWPWTPADWRPSLDVGRNLAKAGALIAAASDAWDYKNRIMRKNDLTTKRGTWTVEHLG